MRQRADLTAEAVEGAALALEGVDDVERGDGLALGVLSVGDRVTDDVLELKRWSATGTISMRGGVESTHEDLEDTTGLLVDEAGDTLDTTTTCETADSGLGDTLDVVTKNLPVALGTTLSEALAALAT